MGARYITTDLNLRARFDLQVLNAAFQRPSLFDYGGVRHYQGIWTASYGSSEAHSRNPSEAIDELLGIVEGLPYGARELWDSCISRRFDVGFEGFDERFASRWQIKAPLLQRLASVNGDLVVTIYRDDETSPTP